MEQYRLLIKLKAYGISGNILQWIHYYLTSRSQYVNITGYLSSGENVTSWVYHASPFRVSYLYYRDIHDKLYIIRVLQIFDIIDVLTIFKNIFVDNDSELVI